MNPSAPSEEPVPGASSVPPPPPPLATPTSPPAAPPLLPSHRDTALIFLTPALVLALIAVLPRRLGESPVPVVAMLGSITIGPIIAGWIAGGRLAERSRALHGTPQLHPALLRCLCILGSYIATFAGCVGAFAFGLR